MAPIANRAGAALSAVSFAHASQKDAAAIANAGPVFQDYPGSIKEGPKNPIGPKLLRPFCVKL